MENSLTVLIPADRANAWGITDQVGMLRPRPSFISAPKSNIGSGMLVKLSTPTR
jgi:hypothetical protein